jgi:hypothetical protein
MGESRHLRPGGGFSFASLVNLGTARTGITLRFEGSAPNPTPPSDHIPLRRRCAFPGTGRVQRLKVQAQTGGLTSACGGLGWLHPESLERKMLPGAGFPFGLAGVPSC